MKWLLTVLSGLALSMLSPHSAAAADDGFCSAAAYEQLKAIEGNWTLKQEAGYGIGGKVLPFPLPAHAPQAVQIELSAEEGVAYLKYDGQKMAMIPVANKMARNLRFYLSEDEEAKILAPGAGCDWSSIPLVVGATAYSLLESQGPDRSFQMFLLNIGDDSLFRCSNGIWDGSDNQFEKGKLYSFDRDGNVMTLDLETGEYKDLMQSATAEDKAYWAKGTQNIIDEDCGKGTKLPQVRLGTLVMSLIVKFDSPNSGAGVLQFEGKQGPVSFAARAPVHLSR